MDTTTIIVIVAVVALLALFLYNRSRPAARGTYDDKNVRSSGSIGGGTRAYDDKNVRSSGSIGGGTRAYDAPSTHSGGSIGGGPSTPVEREPRVVTHNDVNNVTEDRIAPSSDRVNEKLTREHAEHAEKSDDKRFKSTGSFGR